MRLQEHLDEAMSQDRVDKILLKNATSSVFRAIQKEIDNFIGNITIDKKDVKSKKQSAFDIILKNLTKRKKDIY